MALNKLDFEPCVTKVLYSGDKGQKVRMGLDILYYFFFSCNFGVKFALLDWVDALWGENYKSE